MSFVSFGDAFWHGGTAAVPASRRVARPAGLEVFVRQSLPEDAIGAATMTISGLPAGTDIVVLAAGTTNILRQVDAHPGTTYAYAYQLYTLDTVVDIGFIKPGYEPFYVRNLTLPRFNTVLPVALRLDRNFA